MRTFSGGSHRAEEGRRWETPIIKQQFFLRHAQAATDRARAIPDCGRISERRGLAIGSSAKATDQTVHWIDSLDRIKDMTKMNEQYYCAFTFNSAFLTNLYIYVNSLPIRNMGGGFGGSGRVLYHLTSQLQEFL